MLRFKLLTPILFSLFFVNPILLIEPISAMWDDQAFDCQQECTRSYSPSFTTMYSKRTSSFYAQEGRAVNFFQKLKWAFTPKFVGFFSNLKPTTPYPLGMAFMGKLAPKFPTAMTESKNTQINEDQGPPRTTRILAVDGGGIRGIIPAKILTDMEQCAHHDFHSDMHLAEYFDFITGTSTGGIIALGLNVPDKGNNYRPKFTSNDLFTLYKDHGEEIFPSVGLLGNIRSVAKPKYDVGPLEKYLQEYFGNVKLSHSISHILITAYDAMQDRPAFFRSYDPLRNMFAMKYVARSTAAAPAYLSGAAIKDSYGVKHHYVDGAVFANNPTFEALLEVRRLEREGILPRADRYVILSLGTGECPSSNYWEKIKEGGLYSWANVIPFLMMKGSEKLAQSHLDRYLEDLRREGIQCEYTRVQPILSLENIDLDNASAANLEMLIAKAREASSKHQGDFKRILGDYHQESQKREKFYTQNKDTTNFYHLGMLKKKEGKITESIRWFTEAAEQGHQDAQYMLAWLIEHNSEKKDQSAAEKWYAAAANQGHRDGLYKLGRLSTDRNKKREYFEMASTRGHRKAPFEVALLLEGEGKGNEVERKYKESANRGYVKALYKLGMIYERKGRMKEAENHYRQAAELDVLEAQVKLGIMCKKGQGVPKDEKEAVYWFTKAAEQGDRQAQFELGWRYDFGQGAPKDLQKAVTWYIKAAEQGHGTAQFFLAFMYVAGQGVPKDEEMAREWLAKSAEQGFEMAQCILGECYETGTLGLPKDEKLAREWLTKSAEQGFEMAKFSLKRKVEKDQEISKDEEKANGWWERYSKAAMTVFVWWYSKPSATQGDKDAELELTKMREEIIKHYFEKE